MNESELSLGLEFGVWGVHEIEDGLVTLFKLHAQDPDHDRVACGNSSQVTNHQLRCSPYLAVSTVLADQIGRAHV